MRLVELSALALAAASLACDRAPSHDLDGCGPIVLDPARVDFGPVLVGTEVRRQVRVRAGCEAPAAISLAPQGDPLDGWDVEPRRVELLPGRDAVFSLRFRPSRAGPQRTGRYALVGSSPDAARPELLVSGRGVALAAEVHTDTLDFGGVLLGRSRHLGLAVTNPGRVPIVVDVERAAQLSVGICREGAPYCVSGLDADDGLSLEPGQTARLDVAFAPGQARHHQAQLEVRTCPLEACRTRVTLEGRGFAEPLVCTPSTVRVGPVSPGHCQTARLVCENVLHRPVAAPEVSLVTTTSSLSATAAPDFGAAIQAGESLDVQTTFCPSDLTDEAGELTLRGDTRDLPEPLRIPVEAYSGGPELVLQTDRFDFGPVGLIAGAEGRLRVTNRGTETLELRVDAVVPASTFRSTEETLRVEPGASAFLSVEARPVEVGQVRARLRLRTNDLDRPQVEVLLIAEGVVAPPCQLAWPREGLDVGHVSPYRATRREVALRNLADTPCLLTSLSWTPASAPELSLPGQPRRGVWIAAHETYVLPVEVRPAGPGPLQGRIRIGLASSETPAFELPVTAEAAPLHTRFFPDVVDFATVSAACGPQTRTVRLFHDGPGPLVVTQAALTAPGYPSLSIGDGPQLPVQVAPRTAVTWTVTFAPGANPRLATVATLAVDGTMNGAPVRHTLPILAARGPMGTTERYVQLGAGKVDVVFVLDFTGSMGQEQRALATHAQDFLQFAEDQGLDYRVGVIEAGPKRQGRLFHTDRPRSNGTGGPLAHRFAHPGSQPSAPEVLAKNLQAVNLYAAFLETAALFSAYLMVTEPTLSGPNLGLLRPDAALSLVLVSNNPEQTPWALPLGAPTADVSFYVDYLRSVVGVRHLDRLTLSALAAPPNQTCAGPDGSARAHAGYEEVTRRAGGAYVSICSTDWRRTVEELAPTVFGVRHTFPLRAPATSGTLHVLVDGTPIPARDAAGRQRWTYDDVFPAVRFAPFAVPEPGATVEIRYQPDCAAS